MKEGLLKGTQFAPDAPSLEEMAAGVAVLGGEHCPRCQGGWIHSEHYHCRSCGTEMESPQVRLEWKLSCGVRRVGVCDCGQILVEREKGWPRLIWKLLRA